MGYGLEVINEIELIVSEVFKIKTYGYPHLKAYRIDKLKKRITT